MRINDESSFGFPTPNLLAILAFAVYPGARVAKKRLASVHNREIADVRKDPAASPFVLDCEAGASELPHLLLVGKEFFGHLRSSRKVKGEPAGSPPVPGIESFWTLITVMMLSANLRPVKAHAPTIHAQS